MELARVGDITLVLHAQQQMRRQDEGDTEQDIETSDERYSHKDLTDFRHPRLFSEQMTSFKDSSAAQTVQGLAQICSSVEGLW